MHRYRLSGLSVVSELELPGVTPCGATAGGPDVAIRFAPVPQSLEDAADRGPNWDLRAGALLLRVPRVARFLIALGERIDVALEDGAGVHEASGFVLGPALGILLHQRGTMVLHAAAVARDGEAIAICGASGMGKSTLAAALCRTGCAFVTDDLCAIGFDAANGPVVHGDGRRLKLWADSIERLGLGARRGAAVREPFEKYLVEPGALAPPAPRLRTIYLLRERRPPLVDGIEPLAFPDAARALDREAYRPSLRRRIDSTDRLFATSAAVLAHARVATLTCPRDFDAIDATADALLRDWDARAA